MIGLKSYAFWVKNDYQLIGREWKSHSVRKISSGKIADSERDD